MTKKPVETATSYQVVIPITWGFKAKDLVTLEMYRTCNPELVFKQNYLPVFKSGKSMKLTIPKEWGITKDDWVTFTVYLTES